MQDHANPVTPAPDMHRRSGRRAIVAGIAAIGSVFAALLCCLPVFPFVLAAGFAGTSAFLPAAGPYLLGASVLFIAYGFIQARRARKCHRRASTVARILLLISALLVMISIFFPQAFANAAANLLGR